MFITLLVLPWLISIVFWIQSYRGQFYCGHELRYSVIQSETTQIMGAAAIMFFGGLATGLAGKLYGNVAIVIVGLNLGFAFVAHTAGYFGLKIGRWFKSRRRSQVIPTQLAAFGK